jgi:hypothetical protein
VYAESGAVNGAAPGDVRGLLKVVRERGGDGWRIGRRWCLPLDGLHHAVQAAAHMRNIALAS